VQSKPVGGSGDYIEGLVEAEDLRSFLFLCFSKAGVKKPHVTALVDQLVNASLRGIDTHGAVLTERYLNAIKSGEIKLNPRIRKTKLNQATEILDGDFGVGQYVAQRATQDAMSLASRNGIGGVWVVNMSHCAMLAQYGLMIAKKRMAGLLFTNSNAGAAPFGGREKVFGTNPLCFAFPYERFPIVFDGATTAAAGMKIQLAMMEGKQIPLGWALDEEGRPTTDPTKARTMLPFGGHKGYALMFMVEVFSAILSGGNLSRELKYRDMQGGLYVQAIDIQQLRRYGEYSEQVGRLVGTIASSAGDGERVYVPGEIEFITSERRKSQGIPVHRDIWRSLSKVAMEYGAKLPALRQVQR
jgi:LDH2 family malate/lactate/ureidoglycolate dehydrogenase